jgi:hypothetical protein
MPNCSFCGASTELYVSGKPICLQCDEAKPEERRKTMQRQHAEPKAISSTNARSQTVVEIGPNGIMGKGMAHLDCDVCLQLWAEYGEAARSARYPAAPDAATKVKAILSKIEAHESEAHESEVNSKANSADSAG